MSTPWPLVGRRRELDRLTDSLTGGVTRCTLVTGEAGIGKSRLAAEVRGAAARRGFLALRVTATPGWQSVPFGVLSQLVTRPVGPSVAAAFRDLTARLRAAAAGRPVLVVVDDVNWLDDASSALLERLVAGEAVRVLASARSDAVASPAVTALRRLGPVERVELAALTRPETGELIEAMLGGPTDGLTLATVWQAVRGNPLFLREMLRGGRQSGALARRSGVWTWRGAPSEHPHLGDLVAETLNLLDPEEVEALQYVAHGGPAPLPVIERLVAAPVAERLEERGLIELTTGEQRGLVRVAHPLYAEAARARTGALRTRRILRELADALEATSTARHEDRLRVVSWRCDADLAVDDADLLAASESALLRRGARLAERLARRVEHPRGARQLGRALVAQGRGEEADEHLRRAYESLDDPRDRAETAALRAVNLFWGLRLPEAAGAVLAEAVAALPAAVHDGLLTALAAMAVFDGRTAQGRAAVARLAQHPPRDALLGMAATPLLPHLLVFAGEPARAAALFDAAEVTFPQAWPAMRAATQALHVQALVMAGELTRATESAEAYYLDAVEGGSADGVALLALMVGNCRYHRGRRRDALRWLREARALVDGRTPFPIRGYVLSLGAWFAAQAGEARDGDEPGGRPPGRSGPADFWGLAEAWTHAGAGRTAVAAGQLTALAGRARENGALTVAVQALHLLSRVAPSRSVAVELRRVADACDSPLFDLYADLAAALARPDPEALERLATTFGERGYATLELEATIAAGAARRGRGEHRAANAHATRAEKLRRHCDAYWPAWCGQVDSAPTPLTGREREICALAATGLDNSAIARRLRLSVRTVENHLQRSYHKLGVRSRLELAGSFTG
ncbi:AAA family ATPase [Micromonospora sp. KLBMP9576]|uniref:AAA family ATPase n=1 Tax=Micromonospora sp. KLBMP9576 TaxID=3424769 RepID=UPI003D94E180